MSYIPHTEADRTALLAEIGVDELDELFRDVPKDLRYPDIDLMPALSEMEVLRRLQALSEQNVDTVHFVNFLGAGAYDHFVPSVVRHITSRSEFYTAYTPYQPEISQGTLQSIYEYQSLICALTGMDVANASHYDGATALAEAVLMAHFVNRRKRKKVLIAPTVHPEYRQTIATYVQGLDVELIGDDPKLLDGINVKWAEVEALLGDDTACLVVQNPDFMGQLHVLDHLARAAHEAGAMFIVSVDPISLGLFQPPAAYGADIVVGEGQSLGLGLQFGGPYLGFLACPQKHVHKMSGRLVGETEDVDGKRGYVLTLTAREQHIRRERATSNICTNQGLCALAAAVYLSALGKTGLQHVANLCYQNAHYAAEQINALPGYQVVEAGPFFKEFVVKCPQSIEAINDALLEQSIVGGYGLENAYPHLERHMLLCVTETISQPEIDYLVEALQEATS